MLNTLKYAKQLEEAGVSRQQAEAHIQIIGEIMETNLATQQDARDLKQEIRDLKQHTEYGFRELKQELNNKILEVNSKMIQSEQRTIIKLGTIISLAIGVAVTLTKLVA